MPDLQLDPSEVEIQQPKQVKAAALPAASAGMPSLDPSEVELAPSDVEMAKPQAATPPTPGPVTLNARRGGTHVTQDTVNQAAAEMRGALKPPPPSTGVYDPFAGQNADEVQQIERGAGLRPETEPYQEVERPIAYPNPADIQYPNAPKPDESLTGALARGKAGPPEAFAPVSKAIGDVPMLPVGTIVRHQVAQAPKTQSPFLAAIEDAGIISGDVIQGLSTPSNLALLEAMAAAPEAVPVRLARVLVDAGFSVQMANGAAHDLAEGYQAWQAGDKREAIRRWGGGSINAIFAVLSGKGSVENARAAHTQWKEGISASKDPAQATAPQAQAPVIQPATTSGEGSAGTPAGQPAGEPAPEAITRGPIPERFKPITLSPSDVEVQPNAVRRGDAEVQGGQAEVGVNGPDRNQPEAGGSNNAVGEAQGGRGQGGVPATGQETPGRPVSGVKPRTRLALSKEFDDVRKGTKAAALVDVSDYNPEKVARWMRGLSFVTVEHGRRLVYNPNRTSPRSVQEHIASGTTYKLTGEAPPEAARQEARQDLRPEETPSDVILARHGETALDKEGSRDTVAGWSAEPLDGRGRQSAAEMADELRDQPVHKIVTSDLERAQETANIVGQKLGVPVETDARLRPQHTPETEGLQMKEAKPIHDHYVDNPDARPHGGETHNETLARQKAAIEDARASTPEGEKPVILTHSRNLEAEVGTTPEPGGIVEPQDGFALEHPPEDIGLQQERRNFYNSLTPQEERLARALEDYHRTGDDSETVPGLPENMSDDRYDEIDEQARRFAKLSSVRVPVGEDESQGATVSRPDKGQKEQLPGGVSERRPQGGNQPKRAQEKRIDYERAKNEYPKQKSELTRAVNLKDREQRKAAVLKAATKAVNAWEEWGAWPDYWSRWQRALDDAYGPFGKAPQLEDLIGKAEEKPASAPVSKLRERVTGAIERGEKEAIVDQPAEKPARKFDFSNRSTSDLRDESYQTGVEIKNIQRSMANSGHWGALTEKRRNDLTGTLEYLTEKKAALDKAVLQRESYPVKAEAKPAEEPKYKYRSTQTNIPKGSEAAAARKEPIYAITSAEWDRTFATTYAAEADRAGFPDVHLNRHEVYEVRSKMEQEGATFDAASAIKKAKEIVAEKLAPPAQNGPTIEEGKQDANAAREPRPTQEVSPVPSDQGAGGNARAGLPASGERPAQEKGDIRAGAGREGGELLERPSGREEGGAQPARSGRDSAAPDTAAGRADRDRGEVGADGRPVEEKAPETVDHALDTAKTHKNTRNFRFTDEIRDSIGKGGEITKLRDNLDALELLKKIQAEGREAATDEERAVLAKYVDFGGLVGMIQNPYDRKYSEHFQRFNRILTPEERQEINETLINTHYTSLPVVDRMWKIMQRLGFKGGRILEPGMGIGNFLGAMPEAISHRSDIYGVEKNPLTGAMAKLIYPDANIQVKEFQQWQAPNNSLDAVIGNPPFASTKVTDDPLYKKPHLSLHNYFIVKALDKLKPGGIATLITSRYSMDGAEESSYKAREEMAKRADLVAAIRLPESAFEGNARTKVVADMLIFQKRSEPMTDLPPWVNVENTKVGSKTFPINKYFVEHPEMVMGEHSDQGSMYKHGSYTVKGPKDLGPAIDAAIEKLPEKIFGKKKPGTVEVEPTPDTMEPLNLAPANVKAGAFFLDDKGKVKIKQSGAAVDLPPELRAPDKVAHIKTAIGLRDKLNELISAQLSSHDDADFKKSQAELNKLYESYVKKYGELHGPKLKKVFGDDPEYPKLLALENRDPETTAISKADIFSKRVLAPYEPLRDLPADPKTAMLKVMAATGKLDIEKMAELLKKPQAEVVDSLEKANLIFQDPVSGEYQTADEYLSGAVRDKLKQAEAAAHTNPQFARNAEELRKVQPKPLTLADIAPNLGQSWVPRDIYERFVNRLAGNERSRFGAEVKRDFGGKWKVEPPPNRFDLDRKWGGGGVGGHKLVEYALNQQMPTVWERNSDGTRYVNADKTAAARDKLAQIKEEFSNFVRSLEGDDAKRVETIYNDTFNGHRLREYSGEHLDFPGMAEEWRQKIRSYQKAAVWRIVQEGRAGIFHAPGLGKTLTMAAAGMEMRRLGLSRRNVYAIPNHMVNQWREDFKRFYPNANVLAVQKGDFTPTNRAKLMSRIATGDWDAIIIPHQQLDMVPMSPEYTKKTIDGYLSDYRRALEEADDERTQKQIEAAIDKLEARLKDLATAKRDNTIPFDQLGVDMLFVDEAHAYKSLPVPTKMGNVRGLNTSTSDRSFAMKEKADFLRETHNGRGIVFGTGTPLTNTIGELYVIQKFLNPAALEKAGIRNFDDWAANFARTKTELEYSSDGVTLKAQTALSRFANVPELSNMFRQYGEYISKAAAKTLSNIVEPEAFRHDVNVRITPTQEPLLEMIARRGEALTKHPPRTREERKADNWLKLSSDARKISLDPRLYDPSYPDDPNSKANKAVEIIKKELDDTAKDKGTVAIFSDFFQHKTPDDKVDFNLFEDMRNKLVKLGVPREQIWTIHEAGDSDDGKAALFAKVRSGAVRVIFGSTDKMGIGTNIQDRLHALMHLDQPWRPDQVEQREGRAVRSGNLYAERKGDGVHLYRFIAEPEPGMKKVWVRDGFETGADGKEKELGHWEEKTRPRAYDLQMYQALARKAEGQEQFLTGNYQGRELEDTAGDVKLNSQSFQLGKALATGNPDAMRKYKVELDLESLHRLERSWWGERSKTRGRLEQYQMAKPAAEYAVKQHEAALAEWKKSEDGKNVSFEFGDRKITDKDELKKFMEANPDLKPFMNQTVKLYGIEVPLEERLGAFKHNANQLHYQYRLAGEWHDVPGVVGSEDPPTLQKLFGSFAARARALEGYLAQYRSDVDMYADRITKLQAELQEDSPYRGKIDAFQKELAEINQRLGIKREGEAEDETEVDAGDDEGNGNDQSGFATLDFTTMPFVMAAEGVKRISRLFNNVSERTGDALSHIGLGKPRPEIRRSDADLADEFTRLDAAYQHQTAKVKQIVNDIVGDLSREKEKGFVLLADQATREWLQDNKPDEYQRYITDPQIISAIERYRPYEQNLREAVQELGGKTIDEDYLHRVYAEHTAGIGQANVRTKERSSLDQLVSPQVDRMRGRVKDAGYYYEKGLHEFGPSFATRWVSVMTKLQEHKTAMDFMSKATKLGPLSEKAREKMKAAGQDPDKLPDSIYYNGKQYFSHEMAQLIKESRPGSPQAKQLADRLGVTELPKPKQVQEYGIYEPLKGKRLENAAAALAAQVFKDVEDKNLAGRAASVMRSLSTRYAGPREITDALTFSRPDLIPSATNWLARKIAPATSLIRQQIIGLGFMVHFANDMRRVAQTAPGGVANPVGWVRAISVAFSKELKERGMSGTKDPTFDTLLRNAGISPHGAEEYRHYVELNTNVKNWFGLQNAFKERGEAAGRVNLASVLGAPFKLAAEAVRPASKWGHDVLFGPGGMDQRSRLWLADYLKSKDPSITEAEIAQAVNQTLGRYNRASWTQLQREIAPFMLFPGWDFSSVAYVLQHPIRTALPPALLVFLANRALYQMGKNRSKDKNDPFYVHVGDWSFGTNLLREPLAASFYGPALAGGRELAAGHGLGRAAGAAAGAVPRAAAAASVNLLNPLAQAVPELAANRERMGTGAEIIKRGDTRRRALGFRGGAAVKDLLEFGAKKVSPLYGRYTALEGGEFTPASAAGNVGVTAFKRRKGNN